MTGSSHPTSSTNQAYQALIMELTRTEIRTRARLDLLSSTMTFENRSQMTYQELVTLSHLQGEVDWMANHLTGLLREVGGVSELEMQQVQYRVSLLTQVSRHLNQIQIHHTPPPLSHRPLSRTMRTITERDPPS